MESWVDGWNVGWLLPSWIKVGGIDEEEVIFRLKSISYEFGHVAQLLSKLERVCD